MRKAKSVKQARKAISRHPKGSEARIKASTSYVAMLKEYKTRKRRTPRSER